MGESVTFTAASTNAASSATYQWQLNGVDITGANGLTYTSASLATGDQIAVVLTPNNICQTASTLISNVITTVVNTTVIPSVSVNSSDADNSICAGESITFTAVPSNGGTAPTFQWLVNGVDQGVSTVDFTTTGLVNGDIVTVIMTPNNPCQSTSTASATGIPIAVAGAAATYFADNDGDGLSFFANSDGNGYCNLDRVSGAYFKQFENDFGQGIDHYFYWNTNLVSTDEIENTSPQVTLVPNPSTEATRCYVSGFDKRVDWVLYNSNGQVVRNGNVTRLNPYDPIVIQRESLTAGLYFIRVSDAKHSHTSKLIFE